MSVPVLVATVFAATFLVVCAVAYVLLGRNSSAAPATPPQPSVAPVTPEMSASPAVYEIHAVRASSLQSAASPPEAVAWAPPPEASTPAATPRRSSALRMYQVLMFATGGTGILASWLMFSAVTEFSRLLVIAAVIFLLSCVAIYRGVVPDPELTGKKK